MRRQFLKWLSGGFALSALATFGNLSQAIAGTVSVETGDLKDTLEKGLYVRLPEQYAFIAKVVMLVEKGKLSLKLVYSTFKWARQYDRGRRYYYFEQAIIKRAAGEGVDL